MDTDQHSMSALDELDDLRCERVCQFGKGNDWYHDKKCPVGKKLRDSWCSPRALTQLLPVVSLDPCSNARSTVLSRERCILDNGQDGLAVSWKRKSVFVNGPYSNLMPWCRKAGEASAFIFLVNLDPSTKWWKELTQRQGGKYVFLFSKRQQFDPPPRIKPSTNSKPQALVCDWEGAVMVGSRLDSMGQWWKNEPMDWGFPHES